MNAFDKIRELAGVMDDVMKVAKVFGESHLEGNAGDFAVKIAMGAELGMSPMESVTGFFIRGGSMAMHAKLMHATLLRSGTEVTWEDCSDQAATVVLRWEVAEGDSREHRETWTMEHARRAGLDTLDHWKKHPDIMLKNRALSAAARVARPELFRGVYEKEELESVGAKKKASKPTTKATTTTTKAKRAEPQLPPAEVELWESWRTDLNQLGNDGHALALRIDTRSMDEVRELQDRLFAWLKPNAVRLSDCSEGLKNMVFERLRKAAHGASIDEADAVFVEVLRESLAEAAELYPDRQVYRKGHRNRPIEDLRTAEEADAYARSLPKSCPAKHRKTAERWLYHLTEEAAA